jgi:hypothetical protein
MLRACGKVNGVVFGRALANLRRDPRFVEMVGDAGRVWCGPNRSRSIRGTARSTGLRPREGECTQNCCLSAIFLVCHQQSKNKKGLLDFRGA